jgi:hypothetical protein
LRLSGANLALIDAVSFGVQTPALSEGRFPDADVVKSGLNPTPGAANVAPVPLLTFTQWKALYFDPTEQAIPQSADRAPTRMRMGSRTHKSISTI